MVRAYRDDVSDHRRRELEAASSRAGMFNASALMLGAILGAAECAAVLARDAVEGTETGLVFFFPDRFLAPGAASPKVIVIVSSANMTLLQPLLPKWIPDVQHSQPLVVLVREGRAIAICGSVRRTAHVHEAGVEFAVEFRGRGYAAHVVAAWARTVRASGIEPLYSADWYNTASRSVARKLELVMYGDELLIR